MSMPTHEFWCVRTPIHPLLWEHPHEQLVSPHPPTLPSLLFSYSLSHHKPSSSSFQLLQPPESPASNHPPPLLTTGDNRTAVPFPPLFFLSPAAFSPLFPSPLLCYRRGTQQSMAS
ncbi:uncharacterized protein DS421_6g185910 [Arachis hypogaea]|nr:uncharacterized protein DS421_6g185910 [Arachis hypogaea]